MLKEFDKHKSLLTPLVVFQVRGSVSASGGHDPEDLLRKRLRQWGLEDAVDFNLSDVVIAEETVSGGRKKTRAYDFVLPFNVPAWEQRIFVQCQFYAGDSGSVSHKNVDQTSTSRAKVRSRFSKPIFVEYVDGAGYFSSLNGDLKNLLSMDDTTSFFQIRSAVIRLRREFQRIGFLCPIDVEQAVIRSDGTDAGVKKVLRNDGYALKEINRSLKACKERKLLNQRRSKWMIANDRRAIVRQYLLLDITACLGSPPAPEEKKLVGALRVPGYGPFHGIKIDKLAKRAVEIADVFAHDRPGLLYTISRTIYELGLSIVLAKISTHLDQVVDVFHVADGDGAKILDDQRLADVKETISRRISQFEETDAREFV